MSPIIFLSHKNKNLIIIFFSKLSIHFSCVCMFSCFSHVKLIVILRGLQPYVAPQAPLSMGFSRQECWSGLPCPPPGDLSNPGIEPASPALKADSLPLSHQESSIFSYLDLNVRTICDPDFDGGTIKVGIFQGPLLCACCCCLETMSCLTLCDPWTVAHQAPLCMGFPKQEYWSVLPFPSPGDRPNPGIEPVSCIGRQILY